MTTVPAPYALLWWQRPTGIVLLSLLAVASMLPASVPMLTDLPAHLSRYHVQQEIAASPYLARYFTFEWRFIPNLGVDLAVGAIAPFVGAELATRIVVALIPGGMMAGMMLTARQLHGRIPWTALFALPLAFAYPFMFGFVNYWMSAALALLAFPLWLHLTQSNRIAARTLAIAAIAPVVMLAHLTGLGILLILCSGAAMGRAIEDGLPIRQALLRAIGAAAPAAWPLIILLIWRSTPEQTGIWFDFNRIGMWSLAILRTNWMPLDIVSAGIVYGVALLPLIQRRRFTYALTLAVPAALLAICVICLPRIINGSDYASVRLIPIACALAILSITPRAAATSAERFGAVAFVCVRLAVMLFTVVQSSAQATSELAALDPVAPGRRIAAFFVSPCQSEWKPRSLVHIQSMATTRRDALVNDQFVAAAGQLMHYRDRSDAALPPSNDVRAPGCARAGSDTFDKAYARMNLGSIDYVWLIDRAGMKWPGDPRLRQIWSNGHSALFEVRRPQAASVEPAARPIL